MNAAANNARRLCEDAEILLSESRYPSALSLAALSIEESGKLAILRSIALARDSKELRDCWREYRSHTRKNRLWPLLQMYTKGARKLCGFRPLVDEGAEHPHVLDSLKQLGFYSDCVDDRHWSQPCCAIDEDISKQIVQIARLLFPKREITSREIELWIECLKGVWKGSMEGMESALAEWHRRMVEEGLVEDSPNGMERFILDGLGGTASAEPQA